MSKVFKDAQLAFANAIEEDETTVSGLSISTDKYLDVCAKVAKMYEALFMGPIASQLTGDIGHSAEHLKKAFLKHPDRCHNLERFVIFELKTIGRHTVRSDPVSGVKCILWSKRNLDVLVMYLDLLASTSLPEGECSTQCYEKILQPYHGWLTSTFVSTVIGFAPTRADIFTALELGDKPLVLIAEFVTVAKKVMSEIQRLLVEHDCDFPDKV